MKPLLALSVCLFSAFSFTSSSLAATPSAASEANQILEKVRDRYDGKDYLSSIRLVNQSDKQLINERKMYMLQKDVDKNEMTILSVQYPVDVRDVSFLIRTYEEAKGKEDEQWMYLPAFRKVRRISAKDKRGAFMGSEFAYFDLDKLRIADFDSKILGEDNLNGRDVVKIERTPISQDVINKSGYHRVIMWVDTQRDLALRQEYFDAKGILFKQLDSNKVEKIQDIWTITHSTMENFVENKTTDLFYDQTQYNVGLEDKLFRKSKMKRGYKSNDVTPLDVIADVE